MTHLDEKKNNVAGRMLGKYADFHKRKAMPKVSNREKFHDEIARQTSEMQRKNRKGKESLNIPKGEKNEGNRMMEGKDEHNRS